MTFSNPAFFLIFLPIAVIGFAFFGRFGRRSAVAFLAFISLLFYAQWSKEYLLLLVASILFNFGISRAIASSKGRDSVQSRWLIAGIVANLSALGYFKYLFVLLNFFNIKGLLHHDFGTVILPLGISFFTFTQIAYLVDLKQGITDCESLLKYTVFVTFFPHLIAGPILHHKEIMSQLREERRYKLNPEDVSLGLTWFTMGLFKKIAIADHMSRAADLLFQNSGQFGLLGSWEGALAYSLQLYFDFSGYSDMAVGLARVFSIRFPINFNSPYKAESIIDFWQRWHMTLSRYIMSYVYSPILMAISRHRQEKGKKVSRKALTTLEGFTQMVVMPTIVTMFLAGIWHGAGLQYIAYGVIHGMYISVNHLWRNSIHHDSPLRKHLKGPLAISVTYPFVLIAEVMFRSTGLKNAFSVYAGMLGRHGMRNGFDKPFAARIILAFIVIWLLPNTQEILGQQPPDADPNWSLRTFHWEPTFVWWSFTTVVFLFTAAYCSSGSTFLYFQF